MSGSYRRALAVLGILMLAIFAQAGAVCQVVNCSLPEPPRCPHHQPEPEAVMTACESLAAIPSSDWTDLVVEPSAAPVPVLTVLEIVDSAPPALPSSSASAPPVLRI